MDSRGFQFKQFFVAHDLCAMKVGTDSILLGSWVASHFAAGAQAQKASRSNMLRNVSGALDIGSGSGLLTLMLAQALANSDYSKDKICLVAVEPEISAFNQSNENFQASPWSQCIQCIHTSIQRFFPLADTAGAAQVRALPGKYDVIVSNPPYFPAINRSSHKIAKQAADMAGNEGIGNTPFSGERKLARHQDSLNLQALVEEVVRLLSPLGAFFCILPVEQAQELKLIAQQAQLKVNSELFVSPTNRKAVKRVAMKLSFESEDYQSEKMVIRGDSGNYSARFKDLCRAYYLNF